MNFTKVSRALTIISVILFMISCAPSMKYVKQFNKISTDLQTENYAAAVKKIDKARKKKYYQQKDRVLFYLDKGIVLYYQGLYKESNLFLEKAERSMEELFTKSISNIAKSYLLNDTQLDYHGEVYENLYVNIFKALNYINLDKPDDALVEVKRINMKLRELEDKYGSMAKKMNKNKKAPKVETSSAKFYNDAFAQYLGYIIYRMQDEEDESLISYNKIKEAWETQPNIYYFKMPAALKKFKSKRRGYLNVFAFTGSAPRKVPVGGKITTYKNYIGISDLSQPITLPNIPFPGMKKGYHFKFEFPVIKRGGSRIGRIEVHADGGKLGELQLLEDMGKVASETFEARKNMIYIKTLFRTVTKGLVAAEAKKKLRKEAGANALFGALIDAAVDAGVDATEKADLRCWRTMPENCYVGEFKLQPGIHDVQVKFFSPDGILVKEKNFSNFKIKKTLNVLDVFSLN